MTPNDESGTIRYTVEVEGDMHDHGQFRETVHELGGEIVNEEEPEATSTDGETDTERDAISLLIEGVHDPTGFTHDELADEIAAVVESKLDAHPYVKDDATIDAKFVEVDE